MCDTLLECINEHLPHDAFETKQDLYNRGQRVLKFLAEFRRSHSLEDDDKIVCVSHSALLSALTASGYEGEGATSKLKDHVRLSNCEVIPLDL